MSVPIMRRARRAFAWAALIPVILTALAIFARIELTRSVELTERAGRALAGINLIELDVANAETGQRGFLLTGDKRYLAPFDAAVSTVQNDILLVRPLVSDTPDQRRRMDQVAHLIDAKLQELRLTVSLRQSAGFAAALDMVRTNRGAELMREIRETCGAMTADEDRLLTERRRRQAVFDTRLSFAFGAAFIASPLLILWAIALTGKFGRQRDAAMAEVTALNQQLEAHLREVDRLNRELESRVEERTASLQRSNADLLQFAYVASHDLQEPLRMVSSYVGLLANRYRGKLDGDADEYIAFAVDGARRMQVLIQDLLSYCRDGIDSFAIAPVETGRIVSDALKNLEASIRESRAEISAGDLPGLRGDAVKLTTVFQNLLSNSLRYHKPGEPPRIRVSAVRDGRFWRFSVADQGIGFSPVYHEKIFAIFQRLHRDDSPGTGIGLALCKRIVEGHGGRIWAESEAGAGATFYFTLPAEWPTGCSEEPRGDVCAPVR